MQDRLPGSLIHSEARALQNFHFVYRPRFIEGKLEDHNPLFSQPPGFARIPWQSQADNAWATGRAELYQAARSAGTAGSVATGARSAFAKRSRTGCASLIFCARTMHLGCSSGLEL